jgi:carbamoylphosphate synthase small subunit
MPDKQQPAILLLEDGTLCNGYAFGAIGTAQVKFVLIPE